jgi:hypothetical protein
MREKLNLLMESDCAQHAVDVISNIMMQHLFIGKTIGLFEFEETDESRQFENIHCCF